VTVSDFQTDNNGARDFTYGALIDLGVSIVPDALHEPWKPKVRYLTHEGEGLDWIKATFGATEEDLVHSRGKGAAFEELTAITHADTHVDAPWHYGPESEGRPARKIDELPLEWFFSDGVVLDLRHKRLGRRSARTTFGRRCGASNTRSNPWTQ
jgi:hypothetical protein